MLGQVPNTLKHLLAVRGLVKTLNIYTFDAFLRYGVIAARLYASYMFFFLSSLPSPPLVMVISSGIISYS